MAHLKNIIAFCILMENNGGILDKSPDYVIEKFNRYINSDNEYEHEWGLDKINFKKKEKYVNKWLKEGEKDV